MEDTQEFGTQKIIENDFELLKNLGMGTYGRVVMAREKQTDKIVALKMVKKDKTKLDAFLYELCISIYLSSHQEIIFTYSSFMDSVDHYVLTQDLAPAGSLHSLIQPGVGIPEVMVKRCALQLTRALEYMHSKALVHRDLKPDNVLLMDKECYHIKLSDFGLTRISGTLVPYMSPVIPYMSPELCKLKHNETLVLEPSVDTWAFGVLLFVAFTGYFPWERAMEADELFQEFVYWQRFVDYVQPPGHWPKLNKKAQCLFQVLLSQDPKTRNPITAVLNYVDLSWGEDIPEETSEMEDYEREVIVIEGEEEFIVVENHGDVECIIINDTTEESFSSSGTSTLIFLTDNTSPSLVSEADIF